MRQMFMRGSNQQKCASTPTLYPNSREKISLNCFQSWYLNHPFANQHSLMHCLPGCLDSVFLWRHGQDSRDIYTALGGKLLTFLSLCSFMGQSERN